MSIAGCGLCWMGSCVVGAAGDRCSTRLPYVLLPVSCARAQYLAVEFSDGLESSWIQHEWKA